MINSIPGINGDSNASENNNKKETSSNVLSSFYPTKVPIMAPMVGQSELPFRMLCRKYGAQICYTPMISGRNYVISHTYRKQIFTTCPEDRPLAIQLAGNDPDVLLEAATLLQNDCDYIDLNCGCPQAIAKRGFYGAFLLEKGDLLVKIVEKVSKGINKPLSVKVRILPSGLEDSIKLYKRLEQAGASKLTIHGRTRLQNKGLTGIADWDAIKKVKESLSIPVVANGNIETIEDVHKCLEYTSCDGVMTAEGLLDSVNAIFPNAPSNAFTISLEYLDMVVKYGYHEDFLKDAKAHCFKFLANALRNHAQFYQKIMTSKSVDQLISVVQEMEKLHPTECEKSNCCERGGYYHRFRKPKQQVSFDEPKDTKKHNLETNHHQVEEEEEDHDHNNNSKNDDINKEEEETNKRQRTENSNCKLS